MSAPKSYVDFDDVTALLGGDDKHLKDFCEAGILSFTKFKDEYRQYLLNRKLENLRKTGHRMKPVAQILSINEILDEYENAKGLIQNEESVAKLKESVRITEAICNQIIKEFKEKIKSL